MQCQTGPPLPTRTAIDYNQATTRYPQSRALAATSIGTNNHNSRHHFLSTVTSSHIDRRRRSPALTLNWHQLSSACSHISCHRSSVTCIDQHVDHRSAVTPAPAAVSGSCHIIVTSHINQYNFNYYYSLFLLLAVTPINWYQLSPTITLAINIQLNKSIRLSVRLIINIDHT